MQNEYVTDTRAPLFRALSWAAAMMAVGCAIFMAIAMINEKHLVKARQQRNEAVQRARHWHQEYRDRVERHRGTIDANYECHRELERHIQAQSSPEHDVEDRAHAVAWAQEALRGHALHTPRQLEATVTLLEASCGYWYTKNERYPGNSNYRDWVQLCIDIGALEQSVLGDGP